MEAAANDARSTRTPCDGLAPAACDLRARKLYERAATQGNAEASLKLGDFFYGGRGRDDGDAAESEDEVEARLQRAVAHYQAAHDLRLARATFNLAWCYQRGAGVRRDFHLAKRHYGLAADGDGDAAWPVRLAVVLLYAEWGLYELGRRAPPPLAEKTARLGRLVAALDAHDAAVASLLAVLAGLVAARYARRRAAPLVHEHQD